MAKKKAKAAPKKKKAVVRKKTATKKKIAKKSSCMPCRGKKKGKVCGETMGTEG